jgi:hypothetical protein
MGPGLFRAVLIVIGLAGVAGGVACSLGVSGNGPNVQRDDAADSPSIQFDAAVEPSPDGGEAEAAAEAGCPGIVCNGTCMTDTDCRSCAGAPLLCPSTGQCMASCQGCSASNGGALPIECFACDRNHANPIGSCQPNDPTAYCLSGDYAGQYQNGTGYRCSCSNGNGCPGATQVCIPLGNYDGGFCLTCGESTVGSMQGVACTGGGSCQASLAACQ